MGNPLQHALSSVKKFGGVVEDYIWIHQIMDASKRYIPDWRHRALFHNTFGIHMMEEFIIGPTFSRKFDEVVMDTRTVVSEHIKEDLAGVIPTPADFLKELPLSYWMSGFDTSARKNSQTSFIGGSEQKPVVFERISWHKSVDTLPTTNMDVMVSDNRYPTSYSAAFIASRKIFKVFLEDRTEEIVPEYWARKPKGPA
jgi:hypothetical protein